MIILARHGETPANNALLVGSAESRVQGFSREMPLTDRGELQSRALGRLLGRFVSERSINVSTVYSSDALRATATRDHLLDAAQFDPSPATNLTDTRLREINKGNLEGMLRSEAYPDEATRNQQATDWHFRHGK